MIRRRWFQLSLRGVAVAVTAVCIWLGWNVERARKQRRLVEAIERFGGDVGYDFDSSANATSQRDSPIAAWIRQVVGPDFLHDVVEVNFAYRKANGRNDYNYGHMSDDVVPLLVGLTRIRKVVLHYDQATDESFKMIGALTSLEEIDVINGETTDKGIGCIKSLPHLKSLRVSHAALTDQSLVAVSRLPSLESLEFFNWAGEGGNMRFTDGGLMSLAKCSGLRNLLVRETGVTDAGTAKLKELLPDCSIKAGWNDH